jgi:hypothetical protein
MLCLRSLTAAIIALALVILDGVLSLSPEFLSYVFCPTPPTPMKEQRGDLLQ